MIQNEIHDLGQAAAENPGKTALIGLLSSPIAMKAAGATLRWARRHPVLAIAAAAGAYALYRRRNSLDRGGWGYGQSETLGGGTGTAGLNATGETGGGVGSRASGVTGDADGWSGGWAGGTARTGAGVAGSGADSSRSIAGASSATPSARAGL